MSGLAQNRQIKTSPIFKKIFSKRCNNSDSPTVYKIETVDNRKNLQLKGTHIMKKLLIFTVTAAMLLSLAACAQSAKPAAEPEKPAQTEQAETTDTENVQIPNPWTDYDSKDDAAQAAGFDLAVPDEISGCSEKSYRVLSAEGDVMFEIIYASGEDETARIRKAPGADDVSGNYTVYAETETVDVGGVRVTMKGADGFVKLAVWTNGDYSYALSVESGLSQNDMAALVSNIQ